MNSSSSILSTAVVAAVLGGASLAVQAQSGTTAGTPYPSADGTAVESSPSGGAIVTPPGQGGMGTDAAGTGGTTGTGTDAAGTTGTSGMGADAPATSTHQPELGSAPGGTQDSGSAGMGSDAAGSTGSTSGSDGTGSGAASGPGSDAAGSGTPGTDAGGTFGTPGAADAPPTSTHQPEMLNAPGSPQEGPGALAPDSQSRDAQGMGTQGTDGSSGPDAAGSMGGSSGMGAGSQGSDAGGTFGTPGAADAPPTSTHQPEMLNAPGSPQEGPGALAPDSQGSGSPGMGSDAAAGSGYGGGTSGYGTGGSDAAGTGSADRAGAMGAGSYGSGTSGSGMGAGSSSMGATGMGSDAASGTGMSGSGQSWLPYTSHGYFGASLGRADLDSACPTCENPDWSGKVFTGGMLNEWSGVEASWIWFGEADRAGGGDVRAHGLNLSYVLSFPVSQGFNVFGKLGGTYGWTDLSGGAVGTPSGEDNGFGLSYGLGGSMDVAPNWAVMLEWERHRLKFINGRESADLVTLGVKYRF